MIMHMKSVLNAPVLALAFGLAASTFAPVDAAQKSGATSVEVALSSLGDLTPYRTIASDTLAIVVKGDIPAARTRIKDLETSWDKAEATLKPKDTATWTAIDKMIDDALIDLRVPAPKPAVCATSLKALIAKMDAVAKA